MVAGRQIAVRFGAIDRLVSFFRLLSAEQSLDNLQPGLRILQARASAGTRKAISCCPRAPRTLARPRRASRAWRAARPSPATASTSCSTATRALGYLRETELTRKAFITHPVTAERLYPTGDRGRYLPDGDIEFLGRVDHQVKVHGFRIEIGEVEAALLRQEGVSEAAVTPVEEDGDRRLAAFVTIKSEFLVEPAVLRQKLKTVLPWYTVSALVVILQELPKNRNGKIDRAILQSMSIHSGVSDRYVAPVTPLERQLSRVFEEILVLEHVGSTDSFFDLGGDSILATKLAQRIRDQLSVQMSTQEIFEYPTVSAIANEVIGAGKTRLAMMHASHGSLSGRKSIGVTVLA